MDSEIGVGRNWSSDSADSCLKFWTNSLESVRMMSLSTRRGLRNSSSEPCDEAMESMVFFFF